MSPIEGSPVIPFTYASHLSRLTIPPSQFLNHHPHIKRFMTGTLVFQSASPTQNGEESEPEPESEPKILLLRRAPIDSYPLSWELPGGSADPSDLSVLSAAARELWEETSLVVCRFVSCLGLLPLSVRPPPPDPEVEEWGIPPGEEEDPLEEVIYKNDGDDDDDDEKQQQQQQQHSGESCDIKLLTFLETNEVWGKITLVAEVKDTGVVKTRPDEHVESAWVTEREVLTGWLDGGERGRRVLGFLSPAVRSQALEAFRLRRERSM